MDKRSVGLPLAGSKIAYEALTEEQKTLARKALGLPNHTNEPWQNRFFAGSAHPTWEQMVRLGYACRRNEGSGAIQYWLTAKAAQFALDHGETLNPRDFPERPN